MKRAAQSLLLAAGLALSLAAQANPEAYPNAGHEAPSSTFVAAASGELVAYYTGLSGGYTNLVGLRINGVDGPAGLSNHGTAYGTPFALGTVAAGDSLVFFIDATDYDGKTTRYYSDKSLNADHVNHAWANAYAGDAQVPAGVSLAFEDLANGGDFNYGDHGFVVAGVTAIPAPVPEPASWMLLLGGAAGLATLRRRR